MIGTVSNHALSQGIPPPLYKETNFQTTPEGKIPKDWQNIALEEVATDLIGGGTPSTAYKEYWNGNIAWMTSAHINGMSVTKGQKYITKQGLENSATHLVPKENLLVATRVGIGKVAVNQIDIAISQDLTGVIVDKAKADPAFLYWAILSNKQKLKALAQGSTIKGILRDDLGKLKLPMPPNVAEQRAIVGVLGIVDSAIELADRVIAKTERLKRGLMQQLLTHGIGHTETKQTPIGTIPKNWQIKTIEDLFIVETGTTPSTREEAYWKDGTVNWLTPTDLSKLNGKMRIKGSERKITQKALKETSLTLMPKGSIILSTRAPVGYVATLEEDSAFNQGCKGLMPRSDYEMLADFYSYYLSSKKGMLQNLSSGSTFLELSKSSLEQFKVPYLSLSEQNKIVAILSTVDKKRELETLERLRLENIKRGLMDLLLTGKVRIKVD